MQKKFIAYELEKNLSNPYVPIEEEITGMVDGRDDVAHHEPIEEVDDVQIGGR